MYHDLLKSFIRQRVEVGGDWLELDFTWTPELLGLVRSRTFSEFQWLGLRNVRAMRAYGIRPLINESFLSLSDLEAAGFYIKTTYTSDPMPVFAPAGRYVIAALESAQALVMYDCVNPSTDTWFVQAEHMLSKRPHRR